MIYCTNQCYAKVWTVDKKEKYLDLRISTSEKDKDGNYVNSSWFPRVIGHAFQSLKNDLKEGDRIKITQCKFTNEPYKTEDGKTKSSFRMLILDAEIVSSESSSSAAKSNQKADETPADNHTDECPW